MFPTQIVVTKELDFGEHVWLGALSGKLGKREMQEVLENIQQLSGKEERELADSVLEVSTSVNRHIVEEMIGDDSMCNTLMEIMAPHIELIVKEKEEEGLKKGLEQGLKQGRKEGIYGTVEALRDFGHTDLEIMPVIIKKYGISEREAEEYFSRE